MRGLRSSCPTSSSSAGDTLAIAENARNRDFEAAGLSLVVFFAADELLLRLLPLSGVSL